MKKSKGYAMLGIIKRNFKLGIAIPGSGIPGYRDLGPFFNPEI